MSLLFLNIFTLLYNLAISNRNTPASELLHLISKLHKIYIFFLRCCCSCFDFWLQDWTLTPCHPGTCECWSHFITALWHFWESQNQKAMCHEVSSWKTKKCEQKDTAPHNRFVIQSVLPWRPHFIHNWLCRCFVMLTLVSSVANPTHSVWCHNGHKSFEVTTKCHPFSRKRKKRKTKVFLRRYCQQRDQCAVQDL